MISTKKDYDGFRPVANVIKLLRTFHNKLERLSVASLSILV